MKTFKILFVGVFFFSLALINVKAEECFTGADPNSGAFLMVCDDITYVVSTKTPSGACAGPATACSAMVFH